MAALKHPCVGDLTYGADPTLAAPGRADRQWLHAVRLGLRAPRAAASTSSTSRTTPRTSSTPWTPCAMPSEPDLTVRPATLEDADALATLYLAAREAAFPAIPRPVHPPEPDVRRWMRARFDAPGVEVWLAERDAVPVGLLLLEDDWVHSLYVDPRLHRAGHRHHAARPGQEPASRRARAVGVRVQRRAPGGSTRGTASASYGAPTGRTTRRASRTSRWPGRTRPRCPGCARRIDALDDRLAALLAERAGLTARVQRAQGGPGPRRSRPEPRGRDRRADGPARARRSGRTGCAGSWRR